MRKCVVIGGGFAGLSAAVYLSRAGVKVHLLEASPKLGGRSYSFREKTTGDTVDNGQHLLRGCYNYTLDFLKLLGTDNLLPFPNNLHVPFVDKNGKVYHLSTSSGFYPFNLLSAILKFNAVPLSDRFNAALFLGKALLYSDRELEKLTVLELLKKENQSERMIKSLWEIIAVGALNADMKEASAKLFVDILKQIFLTGNRSYKMLVPSAGLSKLYCEAATKIIEQNGGKVTCSAKIEKIKCTGNKIASVASNEMEHNDFDFVISAIPPYALDKILEPEFSNELNLEKFKTSPILSAHLWLKENSFSEKFYGLIESDVHWVFNHGSYISVTISGADKFNDLPHDKIKCIIFSELKKYFHFFNEDSVSYIKRIKEKRATIVPSPEIIRKRPGSRTRYNNFFLAGDWTDTKLPATIEGAVKSGKIAAESALLF